MARPFRRAREHDDIAGEFGINSELIPAQLERAEPTTDVCLLCLERHRLDRLLRKCREQFGEGRRGCAVRPVVRWLRRSPPDQRVGRGCWKLSTASMAVWRSSASIAVRSGSDCVEFVQVRWRRHRVRQTRCAIEASSSLSASAKVAWAPSC